MADINETVLLKFEIDQGSAEKQLIAVNKALLNNKKAQQDLAAAYKKGTITQDEYVEENIRLQANIKKEQQESAKLTKLLQTESNSRNALKLRVSQLAAEYDNLNTKEANGAKRANELEKELKKLNDEINKGSEKAGLFKDQIGNYPKQFGEAAKSMNIAGVSVGGLAQNFTSLLNPATATVAVIGALGAAYARSTIGAKDLEFASNELSAVTTILTNKFAGFISSAEDGEGAMTKLLNVSLGMIANGTFLGNALKLVGVDLNEVAKQAQASALAIEKLEDLERDLLDIRAANNERLEQNQELLTEINQEQTTYNKKVDDANQIISNLKNNRDDILAIEKQELKILEDNLAIDKENDSLKTQVKQKTLEIRGIEKDTTKQVEKTQKLLDNINEAEAKRLEQERQKIELFNQKAKDYVDAADKIVNDQMNNLTAESFGEGDMGTKVPDELNGATGRNKAKIFDEKALAKEAQDTNAVLREVLGERADLFLSEEKLVIDTNKAKTKSNNEYLDTVGNSLQTLSGFFKKGSEAQKAFALASILTNEAKAIGSLVATSAETGPLSFATYAVGITEIISGIAAAISILNESSSGFADGGYTGSGGKYEPKGVVHGNEYVIPSETVNKLGPSYFDRYLPGYADGGYVANKAMSATNDSVIIANALKYLPTPVVSVKEITLAANRIQARENSVKI